MSRLDRYYLPPGVPLRPVAPVPVPAVPRKGILLLPPAPPAPRPSLTSALLLPDASPRQVSQQLLALHSRNEHREAASLLRKLAPATFRQLLPLLPADIFVEAMPHSLPFLEALYTKLFASGPEAAATMLGQTQGLRPEAVVWQLINFFAQQDESVNNNGYALKWEFCGPFISSCRRLLSLLLKAEPRLKRLVTERQRATMKAIEGLGQHGLIGNSDEQLVSLHRALQQEFARAQKVYNEALNKLDSLALVGSGEKNGKSAPVGQSHQRQLSLSLAEVQERLIKNKSVLNVVEPSLESTNLDVLLGILQKRIQLDKDVLFQWTELKKQRSNCKNANCNNENNVEMSVAPVLMRFQRGCQQVLELFKEICESEGASVSLSSLDEDSCLVSEDGLSDFSGYHSDSESCVMTSGNSPFISKEARFNFLSRSVRHGRKHNIRASLLATSSLQLDSASLLSSKTATSKTKHVVITEPPMINSSSGISSGSEDSEDHANVVTIKSDRNTSTHINNEHVYQPLLAAKPKSSPSKSTLTRPMSQSEVSETKLRATRRQLTMVQRERDDAEQTARNNALALNDARRRIIALERKISDKNTNNDDKTAKNHGIKVQGGNHRQLWVKRFSDLYAQLRLETLDDLDRLLELRASDELKNKLLFSVVVLAFRAVKGFMESRLSEVRRLLHMQSGNSSKEAEEAIKTHLRKCVDTFDLDKVVEDVCGQIWSTLYDYPRLKQCEAVTKYVEQCVRVAWALSNQNPAYRIEYETRLFTSELHVRFHCSSENNDEIKAYLWPALIEDDEENTCVYKAVVIT